MNYETTQRLLDAISTYCDLNSITITTENKDWKGRSYRSDFVTLIDKNNVRFEVFDNEIIISFFTVHVHPSGEEDCISGISHRLVFGFNPFARKYINVTTWQYDIKKSCFTTAQPWKPQRRC